jgi:hypothetical protein
MNSWSWRSMKTPMRHVATVTSNIAVVVALLAAAAGVAAHGPDPILSGGRFNQGQALPFSWRSGSVPPLAYQVPIVAAAADVTISRNSQAATFSYVAGAPHLIGYGTLATCGVQGLACFTRNAPTGFTIWMREQGHRFDWGPLRWCQAYAAWPDGCYDVENVILDEFGHVEILNHHANLAGNADYTDAVVQELSRTKPNAGWNAHAFGRCDVASLQLQYDMQGWGAKYSTCLSLSTTLALAASPTAIARGGTTTLTAILKVAEVASYVRLALNPVALRTVTLQRRPAGTTAWATVGTMASGATSGTYAMSVSLQARTEFRALFVRPPDEGLLASTSATVVVAVSP